MPQASSVAAVLAAVLLFAAAQADAITLGRARTAALIGQPLDMRVEAGLEPGEEDPANCVEADVFLGDTRLERTRVIVTIERAPSATTASIRVRTSVAVDEPLVTVFVRAGCRDKVTRRYVVLPEAPNAVVAAPVALPSVAAQVQAQTSGSSGASAAAAASAPASVEAVLQPRAPQTAPQTAQQTTPQGSVQGAQDGAAARAAGAAPAATGTATASRARAAARQGGQSGQGARAAGKAAAPVAASQATGSTAKAAAKPGAGAAASRASATRPRLKLDPVDLLVELDPVLRPSAELTSPVATDDNQRAAAAALWKALNARPEDVLRDAERVAMLESEVRKLREAGSQSDKTVVELKAQLAQEQAQRYANPVFYALVAALVLVTAALVWLFTRGRSYGSFRLASSRRPWWKAQERFAALDAVDDADMAPSSPPQPRRRRGSAAPADSTNSAVDSGAELDDEIDESLFESLKRVNKTEPADAPSRESAAAAPLSMPDFSVSLPSMQRSVNAEELMDMQQQADFFMSLGQHDQAIAVLRNHIAENVETSALAYLDLFKIYHSLGRRQDYEALLEDFARVFSARIPPFDQFTTLSPGLDEYEAAMSRIQSLWPSPKVLDVIEETIFRKPGREAASAFSIEAYRDLLLLYAVAKDMNDHLSLPMVELNLSAGKPGRADAGAQRRTRPGQRGAARPPAREPDEDEDDSDHRSRFAHTNIQPLPDVPAPSPAPAPAPRPAPVMNLDDVDQPLPTIATRVDVEPPQPEPGSPSKPEPVPAASRSTHPSAGRIIPKAAEPESGGSMLDLDDLDDLMNSVPASAPTSLDSMRDPFQPPKSANIGLDIDLSIFSEAGKADAGKKQTGAKADTTAPGLLDKTQQIAPPAGSDAGTDAAPGAAGDTNGDSMLDLFKDAGLPTSPLPATPSRDSDTKS